jgi:hypothetical protein
MMSTTLGPWALGSDIDSKDSFLWTTTIVNVPIFDYESGAISYDEIVARATVEIGDPEDDYRLMAASPTLYAALQNALPILVWAASHNVTGARETLEAARAALAGAGGEVG